MKHFLSILLISCVFTTGIHAQDFKRHEIAFYLSTGDAANEDFGNFIYDVEQKQHTRGTFSVELTSIPSLASNISTT